MVHDPLLGNETVEPDKVQFPETASAIVTLGAVDVTVGEYVCPATRPEGVPTKARV